MATRFKNSCVYDLRYHTISELNHSFQRRRNCILQHGYATLLNLYTQHLKSKQATVFSESLRFWISNFKCIDFCEEMTLRAEWSSWSMWVSGKGGKKGRRSKGETAAALCSEKNHKCKLYLLPAYKTTVSKFVLLDFETLKALKEKTLWGKTSLLKNL